MKALKLIVLIIMVALTGIACKAEVNHGLNFLGFYACDQENFPKAGTGEAGKIQIDGYYDIMVGRFYEPHDKYLVRVAIENSRESSENEEFSMAEGNTLHLKHFLLEYEVPTDWDEIPSVKVPYSMILTPESSLLGDINIVPSEIRKRMEENYAKNSYKNLQSILFQRPPVSGETCTNAGANAKCLTYPCYNDELKMDNPADGGACMDFCTLATGCAPKCKETIDDNNNKTVKCNDYFDKQNYVCDVGPGDYGYCRQACTPGITTCEPLRDPQDKNKVLVTFSCIKGKCVPDNATVNPNKFEQVVVKVTAIAADLSGSEIKSHEMRYTLNVCRSCMLGLNPCKCKDKEEEIDKYYKDRKYPCDQIRMWQDLDVECGWLRGTSCYDFLCVDLWDKYDMETQNANYCPQDE